jgi:tetratricopeptide (TPR) repeat protein
MRSSRFARSLAALVACLLLSASSFAEPLRVAEPSSASVDAARSHHEAGVAAYGEGRFEQAVSEFLAAERLAPRAALSFNIARAYDQLGDAGRALQYYRDYLRREPGAKNAAETTVRVKELEAALASKGVQQLSVRSEPSGASLRIDERLVGATPWTGELSPGPHRLVLAAPGHVEHSRSVQLPQAHALDVELRLEPNSAAVPTSEAPASADVAQRVEQEPVTRTGFGPWPWVSLGAGAAALVGSLGFELARRSAEDDVDGASHSVYHDRYDAMQGRRNTARVLLGIGGALAVTGGVLLYLDHQRQSSAALSCAPGLCAGQVEARF